MLQMNSEETKKGGKTTTAGLFPARGEGERGQQGGDITGRPRKLGENPESQTWGLSGRPGRRSIPREAVEQARTIRPPVIREDPGQQERWREPFGVF